MDGVIVDTEPVHFEVMAQVLADRKAVLSEDIFRTFIGKGGRMLWDSQATVFAPRNGGAAHPET
jgi:beta-phosphoglucomutase-like phosphatase (HAD superfamily)